MSGERGATAVEMIVALTLASVMIPALLLILQRTYQAVSYGNEILAVHRDIQNTSHWLAKDIPLGLSSSNTLSSDPNLGISTDGTNLTIVHRDFSQQDPVTATLTYSYAPANQTLTRSDGGSSFVVARHLAETQGVLFESAGRSFTATITSTLDAYTRTQVLRFGLRGD